MGDNSALVFRRYEQGEISAITTDLDLVPVSVLQFDVSSRILCVLNYDFMKTFEFDDNDVKKESKECG